MPQSFFCFHSLLKQLDHPWRGILPLCLLELLARAPLLVIPWVWKILYDALAEKQGVGRLIFGCALFGAALICQSIFAQTRILTAQRLQEAFSRSLRGTIWRQAARGALPPANEDRNGFLQNLLMIELNQCSAFYASILPNLAAGAAVLVLLIAYTLILSPFIFLFFILLAAFILTAAYCFRTQLRTHSRETQHRLSQLNTTIRDSIAGVQELRVNRATDWWLLHYLHRFYHEHYLAVWRLHRGTALNHGVLAFALALAFTVFCGFSGYRVLRGALSIGAWAALMEIWISLINEGRNITAQSRLALLALAAAERLEQFLRGAETAAPQPAFTDRGDISPARSILDLRNIRFGYAHRPLLFEGDLVIEENELAVLTGASGIGKSTLAALALGLIEPVQGEVRLFGQPLSNYSADLLYQQFGVLFQKPLLFAGTIRDNLLLDRQNIPEQEIHQALESVNAAGFIGRLSSGLDTKLEEGGAPLSVGEQRRLALARALLRKAKLLIVDEPFSGLDPRSIQCCLETLKNYAAAQNGVLCISHDPAALEYADRIYQIREGRIIPIELRQTVGGHY